MVQIGGLEKTSLLDYPGKISAVIFTYGCNLKCSYCHNPELVIEEFDKEHSISEEELLRFLEGKKGKLDAVVITGGEPLLHPDLEELIVKIKEMGFLIKLDTNGLLPSKLENLIKKGLLDYIAMDVKYPAEDYPIMTGIPDVIHKIKKSIKIIMNSGVDYEFRTTYVKGIHTFRSAKYIGQLIHGANLYYVQNFRDGKTITKGFDSSNSFTDKELKRIKREAGLYVKKTIIR
ncbi:MAG TPA: anaerobic ribonucleoside-triphosphate reductase activating protein [Candidatus Dojkabacteria bacterium]|nr:anaerobic ribonucleoside-triphosphate reductase activating protein [Candidatus Dojkabacteria bacterium]HOT61201.1 anaerobic ribonucleoside-triphosphate reductase activating protein [Candidatus Dojkabacteria bacterium]